MDIVTHALMGIVAASPFVESRPVAAAAFVFGSVAPDLDALSRVFGRSAFLRAHQTFSHSLFGIALTGVLAAVAARGAGLEPVSTGAALALGMAFHTLLDVTNTFGLTLFAPFSKRRVCLEWVFFIDAFVLAASVAAVAALALEFQGRSPIGSRVAVVFGVTMALYWTAKALLRRRALRNCPEGCVSLIPSALVPWKFLGCCRRDGSFLTFVVDARTGRVTHERKRRPLRGDDADVVRRLRPFRAMRALSPAYDVIEREQHGDVTRLVCRDLRIRNFATRFGMLEVDLDPQLDVQRLAFHV